MWIWCARFMSDWWFYVLCVNVSHNRKRFQRFDQCSNSSNFSTKMNFILLIILSVIVTINARAPLTQPSQLPLKTISRWIVDSQGKRVKWSCVNWSGAAQKDGVVGGTSRLSLSSLPAHNIQHNPRSSTSTQIRYRKTVCRYGV